MPDLSRQRLRELMEEIASNDPEIKEFLEEIANERVWYEQEHRKWTPEELEMIHAVLDKHKEPAILLGPTSTLSDFLLSLKKQMLESGEDIAPAFVDLFRLIEDSE